MPTLFPPLETQEDDSILPAHLKANFEAIQAIIRAQHRFKNEERSNSEGSSDVGKKRKSPTDLGTVDGSAEEDCVDRRKDRLESCKLQLAAETAVAVESEISLLKNGIAELEALLLQQDDDLDHSEIQFPALPSVIPDDPQEKEREGREEVGGVDATKEGMNVFGGGTK